MKSVLFRIGILAMLLAITLVGCAPQQPEVVEKEVVKEVEVTRIVEVPGEEVVVVATQEPAPEAGPVRIALVLPSPVNDYAWSQSMYEAVKKLQTELGEDKVEIAYSESLWNVPDAAVAIRDYAAEGYDLVIAHGSEYGSSLAQIGPDFLETSFAWGSSINTYQSEGVNNIFAYRSEAQDAGYIIGYMMALMSKTGAVGYCGPVQVGEHQLYFAGVKAGALAANPNIKINEIWTGDFGNVSLMAACAETNIQNGADVLTGGSESITGAVGVAKEKGILYWGSQWNQTEMAPSIVVASQVYDYSFVVNDMVKSHQAGVYGGKVYDLTFQNGGLLIEYNPAIEVPAEVQSKVDAVIAGVKDGSIDTGASWE